MSRPPQHPDAATLRKRKLARIHLAKRDLGLDNIEYRMLLNRKTGKTSCRGMTTGELDLVIAAIAPPLPPIRPISRDRRVRKIYAIWRSLGELGALRARTAAHRRAALDAWVFARSGVSAPEFLAGTSAVYDVLRPLEQWEQRVKYQRSQRAAAAADAAAERIADGALPPPAP